MPDQMTTTENYPQPDVPEEELGEGEFDEEPEDDGSAAPDSSDDTDAGDSEDS